MVPKIYRDLSTLEKPSALTDKFTKNILSNFCLLKMAQKHAVFSFLSQ